MGCSQTKTSAVREGVKTPVHITDATLLGAKAPRGKLNRVDAASQRKPNGVDGVCKVGAKVESTEHQTLDTETVRPQSNRSGYRNTCEKYSGFTEHAYRLLFAFEDHFSVNPQLTTVLPTGTVENKKVLEPEAERGILGFSYKQDIPEELAQPFLGTPFVWKREDGTVGLTQTWPTRFNDKFKNDFLCVKYPQNPDEKHFVPQAVEEFKQTVFKMFGDHEDPPLYLCHKQTQNTKPVYTGTGAALMNMLRTSEEIRKELDIVAINEPDGFTCKWVNGKQEVGEKDFRMTPDEEFALYTKQGWETMACSKPRHQFDIEATLGQKVDFPKEISPKLSHQLVSI